MRGAGGVLCEFIVCLLYRYIEYFLFTRPALHPYSITVEPSSSSYIL